MGIFGIELKLTVLRMQWASLNSPTHLVLSGKKGKAPKSYLSWLGDEKQGYLLEWPKKTVYR